MLFWKNRWVSSKKNLEIFPNRYMWQIFSRMRLKWYFFLKMFSRLFMRFFGENEKKIKVGKVRKLDEKTACFEKNAFILLKAVFKNVGGAKYPGGSRVFCLKFRSMKTTIGQL